MKSVLIIKNLTDGKYNLMSNELFFKTHQFELARYNGIDSNDIEVSIDRKSALEITYTLLDSINLLDKDTQRLIDKIEEKLNECIE